MSLLIKSVEMPTDHPLWIVVHADGTVEANEVSESRPVGWQTLRNAAVPVPPHGRLGDLDEINEKHDKLSEDFCHGHFKNTWDFVCAARKLFYDAPTIIPAEEEVYDKYTDTVGNLHWTGTKSGEHILKAEEGE